MGGNTRSAKNIEGKKRKQNKRAHSADDKIDIGLNQEPIISELRVRRPSYTTLQDSDRSCNLYDKQ